jgi:hypothetical protein
MRRTKSRIVATSSMTKMSAIGSDRFVREAAPRG